jgi:hypothetical protein
MDEALQQLLPELDWSWLSTGRVREKSEKAKENIRQEQNKHQHGSSKHPIQPRPENEHKAMEQILEVENAMEGYLTASILPMSSKDTCTPDQDITVMEWTLITPSELDLDELIECILPNVPSNEEIYPMQLAHILSTQCGIHNWREFANIDASVLYPLLQSTNVDTLSKITESQVETWIDAARLRSIDEIMLEILNGNDDIYFILRENLQSGTPKDLLLWKHIPETLRKELKPLLHEHELTMEVSVELVKQWCYRANIALNTLSWLEAYITPLA